MSEAAIEIETNRHKRPSAPVPVAERALSRGHAGNACTLRQS